MEPAIAELIYQIDCMPGVIPIPDGFTPSGFVGMDTQAESNFWYQFLLKQLPGDHWLQPDKED